MTPTRSLGSHKRSERGAALLIALALVALMTALSLAMYFSLSSDSAINGYYRDFRGSYYAADSGIAVGVQYIENQITANEPTGNFSNSTSPLSSTLAATVQSNLLTNYGSSTTSIDSGNSANSWPASFKITSASLGLQSCTVTGTGVGTCTTPCPSPPGSCSPTGYTYIYGYTLAAQGQAQGSEQAVLQQTGTIKYVATITPAGPSQTSFASFGLFIDSFAACDAPLVPGTFTGPTASNGSWNFGNFSTNYVFTDPVLQSGATASYWFGNTCYQSANPSYTHSGSTIAPNFEQGFKPNQTAMPLPTDTYGQEGAVIDSKGATCSTATNPPTITSDTQPTQAQLGAALKNVSGTSYPPTGSVPSTGVYLPWYTNPTTGAKTFGTYNSSTGTGSAAGGIFVQGNTGNVTLSATTDSGGNPTETYTIVQGSGGSAVTTTVVVDNTTNTTTISSGSTVTTLTGVPTQTDPCTGASDGPATMLYVNGNIGSGTGNSTTGLSGPYSGSTAQPAVQNGTDLTIAASGNVQITGDIKYEQEPVSFSTDALSSGASSDGVLGIYTNSYIETNIDKNTVDQNNNNSIEIDASLAAIVNGGSGGMQTPGNTSINTWTNVGGRIENIPHSVNISQERIYYDRRFSQGVAPPWFPSTSITNPGNSSSSFGPPVVQRTQWIDISHK